MIRLSQLLEEPTIDKPNEHRVGDPIDVNQNTDQLPIVDPSNIGQYLVDEEDQEPDTETPFGEETETSPEEVEDLGEPQLEEQEQPVEPTEEVPQFSNIFEATNWAIQNNKVMRIVYTTKHGNTLTRDVEPHGEFHSHTTLRQVLVTFDETIGDIRAFIMSNISDFSFTGKDFNRKFVVHSSPKKVIAMNILEELVKLADELDQQKEFDLADTTDKTANSIKMVKEAQYLGVQGYWIRNQRCWANCYRRKRASTPSKPTQEVWFECQKEYEDSINKDYGKWDKYADSQTSLVKTAGTVEAGNLLKEAITARTEAGEPIGFAVFETIKDQINQPSDEMLKSADKLMDIALTLVSKDNNTANRFYKIAQQLVREASTCSCGTDARDTECEIHGDEALKNGKNK